MPTFLLSLLGMIPQVLDRVLPGDNPEVVKLKAQMQLELEKGIQSLDLAQIEVNKVEASNPNRTWPTWRESLGYVCVAAVAYHFVIQQFLAFILTALNHSTALPQLDMTGLMTILSAMLGVHYVDSRFNSPTGVMPLDTKKPTNPVKGGRLVDGVWVED